MNEKTVETVVECSGLPQNYAKLRLEKLLFQAGFDPDKATLDEIRLVLADLLQDLILETDIEGVK
jgi:hypothetical protein